MITSELKIVKNKQRTMSTKLVTFKPSISVDAAKKILALKKMPTAIFCANDLLAFGVMRGLLDAGIRIPEDVSLLGYDDIAFGNSSAVPLSSISQPAYQLGVTAAELLISECEESEEHAHQQIKFQPQLVVRASTATKK